MLNETYEKLAITVNKKLARYCKLEKLIQIIVFTKSF
jgi:hypothetical protein